jgi:DNA-binding PadR family transcriptional regulator
MSMARLLVLGLILRKGINHGYGVYSDVTSWCVETWTSVKPGSIYHALEKLESQGMIQAIDSDNRVKPGPSRTEYKVTPEGMAEFESLMASALKSNDFQLFGVGLAFMGLLPRQDVLN